MCDNCFSQEFEWITVSGKGKLVTYTVISIAPAAIPSLNALCRGHCGAGKRLENSWNDTGHHARATENRHGIELGFWHMQYPSEVAAVAKILL